MKIALPSEAIILCGAGASVAEPANLASVAKFLNELEAQCLDGTHIEQALVHQALHGNSTNAPPRFEEIIACLLEFDSTLDCLEYLKVDIGGTEHAPNALHEYMARHIRHGGTVVTTNFDALIEIAYLTQYGEDVDSAPGSLWKVHGSIQKIESGQLIDQDNRTLKADIFSVAAGTPISGEGGALSNLSALLDGTRLLVFGYSFSDTFDVTPALLRSRPNEAAVIEFSPTPLATVSGLQGLPGFDEVARAWRQKGTKLQFYKGDPYILATDHPPSAKARKPKPLLPSYTIEQRTYLIARLLVGQDAFNKANRIFSQLASGAADANIRSRATMFHVRTLPDWDEILAYESTLENLEAVEDVGFPATIILLNGYSFVGPGSSFLRSFARFKRLASSKDISEQTRVLNFGKAYHCFANYLMNRGRPKAALRFAEASLLNRTKYGEPRDIHFAEYACCLSLALAGNEVELRKRLVNLRLYAKGLSDQAAQICVSIAEGLYFIVRREWSKALKRFLLARELYITEGQNEQVDPELELYILETRLRIEGWSGTSIDELEAVGNYVDKHGYNYFRPIVSQLRLAAAGQAISTSMDRLTRAHLERAGLL